MVEQPSDEDIEELTKHKNEITEANMEYPLTGRREQSSGKNQLDSGSQIEESDVQDKRLELSDLTPPKQASDTRQGQSGQSMRKEWNQPQEHISQATNESCSEVESSGLRHTSMQEGKDELRESQTTPYEVFMQDRMAGDQKRRKPPIKFFQDMPDEDVEDMD